MRERKRWRRSWLRRGLASIEHLVCLIVEGVDKRINIGISWVFFE
jgi:hypothetical protein